MLTGKIALVTGAGRGIGQAIAETLANAGATVIATGFNDAEVDAIKKYFGEKKLKVTGLPLNVGDAASREALVNKVHEDFGPISILVNNAGITKDNLMIRMKDEEWDAVLETNLSAVFRMTKLCLRDMTKAKWGRVINMASVVAICGNPGQVNYSASKGGMISFSKSLALEIASRNVTVNCIAPGFIDTAMTKQLTDEQREQLLARIPLNRMGQPQDIANAVLFLASDHASYITGQTLNVNGGMLMV